MCGRVFVSLLLAVALLTQPAVAATDPVPNPFAALLPGERVGEGRVASTDDTTLTIRATDGATYRGAFAEIFKYRDGGSVAAPREFAVGDRVRFVGMADDRLIAVQDFDLLLADQFVSGIVRQIAPDRAILTATDGSRVVVHIGSSTLFQTDAVPPVAQLGYTLAVGAAVRVHGVRNVTTGEWHTETLGAYVTLLPAGSLDATIASAEGQLALTGGFADTASSPYVAAIAFVKERGIVGGYADGTYRPDATINRAEFAKILIGATAADAPPATPAAACFPDVATDAWFASYVCTAKERGIIAGYPDGSFGATRSINLAESAKIIAGAFGIAVADPASDEAWFAPYLAALREKNIIPAELTDVSADLTRGQMAELIRRAM